MKLKTTYMYIYETKDNKQLLREEGSESNSGFLYTRWKHPANPFLFSVMATRRKAATGRMPSLLPMQSYTPC